MKFKHNYYKLQSGRNFTTIRTYSPVDVGHVFQINVNNKLLGVAEVVSKEKLQFCNIPDDILKSDASYKGFIVNDRLDFVRLYQKLTNELLRPETKLTILILRWCRPELKTA